jgi:hypothetical protein
MQQLLTEEPSRVDELAEVLLDEKYFPGGDLKAIRDHTGL